MSSIQEKFENAVEQVKTTPPSKATTQELQLEMYGLFKQANEGDVQGKSPSMINLVARAKYKAWAAVKGLSKEDAMKAYIAKVEHILTPTH